MFSLNLSSFSKDRALASGLRCKHVATGIWGAGQNWAGSSTVQHTDLTSQLSGPQPAPARPGIPSAGLPPGQLFPRMKNCSKEWGLALETVQRRLARCTFTSSCPSCWLSTALCGGLPGWLSTFICRLFDFTASVPPLSSVPPKAIYPARIC